MPTVTCKILDYKQDIVCGDGEEQETLRFANKLANKIAKLSASMPHANLKELLIINAILNENDIENYKSNLKQNLIENSNSDKKVVETLDNVTEYVNNLAKTLKKM